MAVRVRRVPASPESTGGTGLPLDRVPATRRRRGRAAEFVHVHPEPGVEAAWSCHCVCGWTGRARFRNEGAAIHAAELHLRVCPLIRR